MFGAWRYPFDLVLTDGNGWQGRVWRVSTSLPGSVRYSPCLARSRQALLYPYMIFFRSLVLYSPFFFFSFFGHFFSTFFSVQSIFRFLLLRHLRFFFLFAGSGQPSHDRRVRAFSLGKRVGGFRLLHFGGLFIFIWVPIFYLDLVSLLSSFLLTKTMAGNDLQSKEIDETSSRSCHPSFLSGPVRALRGPVEA